MRDKVQIANSSHGMLNKQRSQQQNNVQNGRQVKIYDGNDHLGLIEQRVHNKYKLNMETKKCSEGSPKQMLFATDWPIIPADGEHRADNSLQHQVLSAHAARHQVTPESQVAVELSLRKPKFNFKIREESESATKSRLDKHDLISFDGSSIESSNKESRLRGSISASNFGDVLAIQPQIPKVRKIEHDNLQGFMISQIDNKEDKINKKLIEIQKSNEQYDRKIKEKQWEIELMRKRLDKEQRQFEAFHSKMAQAYENIEPSSDSLLISSRNYEISSERMEQRVKGKAKVDCEFEGFSRKVRKQILYSKCMILETDLLQVGYENNSKPAYFQLYFIVKADLLELQVTVDNSTDLGYLLNDGNLNIQVHNIPAGKKIKVGVAVEYIGAPNNKVGLMQLRVVAKTKHKILSQQTVSLPFSLYRNFITQVSNGVGRECKFVTKWANSCDEFSRDPKGYLQTLFQTIHEIEEGVFQMCLTLQGKSVSPIRILANCRNFAIEMAHQDLIVALAIGSFLVRCKDKEEGRK